MTTCSSTNPEWAISVTQRAEEALRRLEWEKWAGRSKHVHAYHSDGQMVVLLHGFDQTSQTVVEDICRNQLGVSFSCCTLALGTSLPYGKHLAITPVVEQGINILRNKCRCPGDVDYFAVFPGFWLSVLPDTLADPPERGASPQIGFTVRDEPALDRVVFSLQLANTLNCPLKAHIIDGALPVTVAPGENVSAIFSRLPADFGDGLSG